MDNYISNKKIKELYEYIEKLRLAWKKEIKVESEVRINTDIGGNLVFYFYAYFNRETYNAEKLFSINEIMEAREYILNEIIMQFIEIAGKNMREKIREIENKKAKFNNKMRYKNE